MFWKAVNHQQATYGLREEIASLLQGHGFIGESSISAPRVEALKKELGSFETQGGPSHGSATALLDQVSNTGAYTGPEQMTWRLKLPGDMQRAAPEVYRNIRAEGVASLRAWVLDMFPVGMRDNNPMFQEMFSSATQADFDLAECKTEFALLQRLATSDNLEITMRKFAAFIYQKRSRDRSGAQHMLGVRAPGSATDVGPDWLIQSATVHSKLENQRSQCANTQSKGAPKGGKDPKGGKTGNPKGKGRGGKAPPAAAAGGGASTKG